VPSLLCEDAMKTKLVVLLIALALAAGGIHVSSAAEPIPTIILFQSSLASITVDDAEAGTVTATLSWHVIHVNDQHRLTLHTYRLNSWELVFDVNSVPLEPVGSRTVTIKHPLNFGPPTFLLSIVDAQSRIVDQRPLIIAYDVESVTEAPMIDSFTAETESIDANTLASGGALVTVSWEVTNRLPTTNLVFEQVFEDGTTQSVELDRPNLWIPSTGQGPVAPVAREGEEVVKLRLSVVDVITGDVYDEQEVMLDVTGAANAPVVTPAPSLTPVAATTPTGSEEIMAFTATPNTVNPGAAVTLSWQVKGTNGVTIDLLVPNRSGAETVVNALSPQGSATVYLPEYAAYSVEFVLKPQGVSATATATVAINCPLTFFFGQADGCPTAAAASIEAAYQEFEGGFMVWRGDTREIYAFFDDGTAGYYLEASYAAMPENEPTDMPPLDREVPVSGFGKVWANAPGVRDKLGWALAAEEGYTMQLQSVATTREPVPAFSFYLTLPDDTVIGTGYGQWQTVE
jgi:hypothetical protein